eukprot:GHVT01050906.1.p1 GENE.GHVT01050906.1~~GHVT01050906.1.p1  ORF type:complete len:304 (-),score=15.54 GHVT01050906.1:654-1565(-)
MSESASCDVKFTQQTVGKLRHRATSVDNSKLKKNRRKTAKLLTKGRGCALPLVPKRFAVTLAVLVSLGALSVAPSANHQWFTSQREVPSKISAAGQKEAVSAAAGQKKAVSAASVPVVVKVGRPAASSAPPTGSFEEFRECLHWKATDKIGNTSVVARHFKRRLSLLPNRERCISVLRFWHAVVFTLVLVVCGMYVAHLTPDFDSLRCESPSDRFVKIEASSHLSSLLTCPTQSSRNLKYGAGSLVSALCFGVAGGFWVAYFRMRPKYLPPIPITDSAENFIIYGKEALNKNPSNGILKKKNQ